MLAPFAAGSFLKWPVSHLNCMGYKGKEGTKWETQKRDLNLHLKRCRMIALNK